jgi:lipoprotein-anchoring transpeptidase ErfK/SrfK
MRALRIVLAGLVTVLCFAAGGVVAMRHDSSPARRPALQQVDQRSAPTTPPPHVAAPAIVRPAPKPNHCAHNALQRVVLVDLATQHMWLCARHEVALSTAMTSGASAEPYNATPRGTFHIQGLNRDSVLYPTDGRAYPVQYWIPFDAPLYGFHDSSWQTFPYGSPQYRTAGSHGCVHMPLAAIRFLYRWADIGTTVVIA